LTAGGPGREVVVVVFAVALLIVALLFRVPCFAFTVPFFVRWPGLAPALVARVAVGFDPRFVLVGFPLVPAFTLRTPVSPALFLTFATCAPRLRNGRRVASVYFRYCNLGNPVTYVNGTA
jgi:hypothetical protein